MRNPQTGAVGAALAVCLLLFWAAPAAAQPQSSPSPAPDPKAAQGGNPQPAAAQDSDSVADAARKAKAEKAKPAPKKVVTDDDLSSIRGDGVSVVGEDSAGSPRQAEGDAADKPPTGAKTGAKDEAYWRARARQIRDQMDAVDKEIEKTEDEIKKGGGAGFDAQTGLSQNVVYFEDRNSKLKKLQEKRAQLQKQMDDLEDEARKENVPSGWLR